ncbi:hypothetical protein LJR084_005091 [Variovorax sp. LjRoot84]|uniref:hypothetical protein n=1 Tax=Variovorax sp. LjRoot84 TaxID=3342340 RepID=UPI003ECDCB9F
MRTILRAILIFAANVKGISACALSRQLGVTYQTAFVLLHKIRESIVDATPDTQLDGIVHMDGAHVSGRVRKPRVKKPATKTQARDRIDVSANPTHPNRRIVMVIREVAHAWLRRGPYCRRSHQKRDVKGCQRSGKEVHRAGCASPYG